MDDARQEDAMDRRGFLRTTAVAGAGLALSPRLVGQMGDEPRPDDINVALIGASAQGHVLLTSCLKVPGVRFKAVCDIWEAFNLRRAARMLKAYGHDVNAYVDYQEMLDKERGNLDAVLVATPDFWHARQTVACLNAGLHVYCETAMSNTRAAARQMVQTARRTGKLLQIGHQRRSNPRYTFCHEKLLREVELLGRIVAVNGQWNRLAHTPLGWPKNTEIDHATLTKYGYESMAQYRGWRWYKGLGGGPVVELGSHQIDVYNWFLDARPAAVLASGRPNFHDKKTRQWYDTVVAVYEYDAPQRPGNPDDLGTVGSHPALSGWVGARNGRVGRMPGERLSHGPVPMARGPGQRRHGRAVHRVARIPSAGSGQALPACSEGVSPSKRGQSPS
ncbi:MAG: Gfo/Idh/MocA family oxidoreductase [Sedimentisphaerales bacterium]|nr:Gfo/Idh/MocA family oxidoreductase [Sedimentisphaerales bacterium]